MIHTDESKILYNGNHVFAPFNAGLYGIDEGDSESSLQNEESKEAVLAAFKARFEKEITEALAKAGIEYVSLNYYSPRYYNFETDSIDLTISADVDMDAYKAALEPLREKVQKRLDENKSYSGYMSHTSATFEEARDNFEVPCIAALLAGIDFEDFDIYDHLVYAYPCEECGLIHEDVDYMDEEDTAKVKACELKIIK